MRTPDNAPICGGCATTYQVPPLLKAPVDTAARAAGWRIFTGRTYGGRHLDTAMCPSCAAPATTAPDVPGADSTEQEPLFMHLPRTFAARIGLVALLAGLATLFVGAAAFGSTGDHDRSIGEIRIVEPCTAAQAHANHGRGALGEHGDAFYRCRETAPGCYQWRFVYDGRPKTGKTWSRPPCPACSSPSATASPSRSKPSTQGSPAASHSTPHTPAVISQAPMPVADILPVTGTPEVVGLVGTGLFLLGAGLLFAFVPRIVRRRNT